MQTSATSSERTSGEGVERLRQWPTLASTPLLRLSRSGAGRIHLKHEGYSAGGSFFDRVVAHQIERASAGDYVTHDGGAFAVSAAAQVAARGGQLHVVSSADSLARVEALVRRFGAHVSPSDGADERAHNAYRAPQGLLRRDDPDALVAALSAVSREVREAGVQPTLWVLPDYGLPPDTVTAALEQESPVYLELIKDDEERPRTLDGPHGCRRAQTAQREGILVSPIGAEILEAAVNAADEVDGEIVALVPESGHRYLGWW